MPIVLPFNLNSHASINKTYETKGFKMKMTGKTIEIKVINVNVRLMLRLRPLRLSYNILGVSFDQRKCNLY